MGRWLVILSLAMAQCPDIVAAEPLSPGTPGIPLPKPRPVNRAPAPAVTVTVNEALPVQSWPDNPAQPPQAETPEVQDSTDEFTWGLRPAIEDDTPRRPVRPGGGCNAGKRIISAYYWQGKFTASGQPFDPKGMTAAHRTLPFGTRLSVSNPRTGKSVIVVVNDRGPFVSGIDLDLSLGAAQALGMTGTGAVCIE